MNADRGTKVLLALIAGGLFLNAISEWRQPAAVLARTTQADLPAMELYLRNMDANLTEVEREIERLVQVLEIEPQPTPVECVWSLVSDGGTPQISRNGVVNMSPDWEGMSEAGWSLKAVRNDEFIFERCL